MPQADRYKTRTVEIEFKAHEEFIPFSCNEYFSLTCITNGLVKGILNNRRVVIKAPCFLCLTGKDTLLIDELQNVSAQTFSFHPDFLRTAPYTQMQEYRKLDLKIQIGSSIFQRSSTNSGIFNLEKAIYSQLREWFFIIGTEVYAQSDSLWVCRIKNYLIRIMGMLEDLYRVKEQDPVDSALDYIYENYFKKVTLEDITHQAHLNRVSLNKQFHERYECTAMEYLNKYRIKMAEELLIHTGMNLADIAQSVGFEYDTYFIRQFTRQKGMSPTNFRKSARKFSKMV